jgi:hypothetical protein
MPAETANVVIGTIQVVIGILALLQQGGIFRRYRGRGIGRRRRQYQVEFQRQNYWAND